VGFGMSVYDTNEVEDEFVNSEDEGQEVEDAGFGGAFEGEDMGINSALKIKSKIDIVLETIKIDDILTSNFKKLGRSDSLIGLSGVVGEWGVVTPIHVLRLEDEAYMILDGLRRTFGALRNGKTEVPAMVWDFSDKQEGKEKANLLSLMINRSQKFTAKEMWEQLQVLEEVNGANPGLIEFLLQMHSGEAMKLKDVMLSDVEYSEIRDDLMSAITTIEGAYKKLCAERKKENRLAKEDGLVLEGGIGSDPDEMSDDQQLSVDDVKDLLDLTSKDVGDSSLEDLDRSGEAQGEPNYQDVGDRKPIDPKIKQAVLIRDDFKCRCCGTGGVQWLGIIVYHHIIPVFLHGPDSVDNGLTLCSNCHVTLHLYSFGKVSVKLDELDETEQKVFKNIFKFGNIIIEGMKRAKVDKDASYKEDAGSRRHLYPGEGLKGNKDAFNKSQATAE
jgi:5-methylcytosine-specific restriction protein A